jgi:hypothetical protein
MTEQPYTVVCVYDDSRQKERVDLEESTQVVHVLADSPKDAYLKGQLEASESTGTEPIDWAVVFLCAGHHENLNDE